MDNVLWADVYASKLCNFYILFRTWYVARMWERRGAYNVLVRKTERDRLQNLG